MSQQIILTAQKFRYKEIANQFPAEVRSKKKVLFQSELRALSSHSASFGVVAYPSWKDGNGRYQYRTCCQALTPCPTGSLIYVKRNY